jgi:hypothetical protein
VKARRLALGTCSTASTLSARRSTRCGMACADDSPARQLATKSISATACPGTIPLDARRAAGPGKVRRGRRPGRGAQTSCCSTNALVKRHPLPPRRSRCTSSHSTTTSAALPRDVGDTQPVLSTTATRRAYWDKVVDEAAQAKAAQALARGRVARGQAPCRRQRARAAPALVQRTSFICWIRQLLSVGRRQSPKITHSVRRDLFTAILYRDEHQPETLAASYVRVDTNFGLTLIGKGWGLASSTWQRARTSTSANRGRG